MKVVFLQEVPGVAQAGEVKQVAPGFARNYLIPKGLAMVATTAALNTWEDRKRADEKRSLSRQEHLQELHSRLSEITVKLRAKTGGKERLYGALTAGHIATELQQQGIAVDRKDIELSGSIRRLGEHTVLVHVGPGIQAQLKVVVESSGE
ncbi:MAG: 50S ribosomal protein L9 [Dehalococcoidia bacterium]